MFAGTFENMKHDTGESVPAVGSAAWGAESALQPPLAPALFLFHTRRIGSWGGRGAGKGGNGPGSGLNPVNRYWGRLLF